MKWVVAAVLALFLVIPLGSGIPVTRANGPIVVTYDFIANARHQPRASARRLHALVGPHTISIMAGRLHPIFSYREN
jgi:hypothetical protein